MSLILDAEELATELKVTRETVYRKARLGDIPSIRIGRSWRFDKTAVIEALSQKHDPWKQSSLSRSRRRVS